QPGARVLDLFQQQVYSISVADFLSKGCMHSCFIEEGNGKPSHHHPSSHFSSLDDTGVSPLVSSRTCLKAEHLSSSVLYTTIKYKKINEDSDLGSNRLVSFCCR